MWAENLLVIIPGAFSFASNVGVVDEVPGTRIGVAYGI